MIIFHVIRHQIKYFVDVMVKGYIYDYDPVS